MLIVVVAAILVAVSRTWSFCDELIAFSLLASIPALYIFQANSAFFWSRTILPRRRYPWAVKSVRAGQDGGKVGRMYVWQARCELQHPLCVLLCSAELLYRLERGGAVVECLYV